MLCNYVNAFSQVTSLTIDNQTPGWLSSKIEYEDRLTVETLIVTGYVNQADLRFVGSLIKKKLKTIDLENVTYTSSSALPENMFGLNNKDGYYSIKTLIMPLSVTNANNSLEYFSSIDSLVIGSPAFHVINKGIIDGGYNTNVNHWKLREGVDSIADYTFGKYDVVYGWMSGENQMKSIEIPSTLRYIGKQAFAHCTFLNNIVLPDSVEEIGDWAFKDTSWNPDTLRLPKSLKKYYMNATNYQVYRDVSKPVVFYFPESIEYIDITYQVWYGNNGGFGRQDCTPPTEIHIKASTPPAFNCSFNKILQETKVYIPKGTYDSYKSRTPWDSSILIEEISVEGVSIDKNKNLYVGDEITLAARIIPEDATVQTIQWESSNPEVATISENGYLRAQANGTTLITVTTKDGGFKATCKVNVYEHTTGVEMVDKITIPIDKTYTLNAQTLPLSTSDGAVTYSSNNSTIASVNEKGIIVANKRGTCTITATTVDGGYTAICEVTVMQPVEALTMEKHELNMRVGETESIYVQIAPLTADDKTLNWYSRDEEVATVDGSGNVNAMKAGEAWIVAVSNDNAEAKDSCKVIVLQPVNGITLNLNTYQMNGIGESFSLEAIVSPNDASNKEVNWKSSNESVCVVSNGMVVAVGEGTCVIIATSVDGGYIATCTVVVSNDTSIQNINSINEGSYQLFDLQGRKLNIFHKGVNLIRFDDGTLKKIYIR